MSEILSEWCLIYVLRADVDSLSLPYLCPRARLKLVRSFMKSARRQSESTLLENMPSSMWLACSYIESRRPRTQNLSRPSSTRNPLGLKQHGGRRGDVDGSCGLCRDSGIKQPANEREAEHTKDKTQVLNLTTSDHGLATRQSRVAPSRWHHVMAAEKAWMGRFGPGAARNGKWGQPGSDPTGPGSTQRVGRCAFVLGVALNRAGSTPNFLSLLTVFASIPLAVCLPPSETRQNIINTIC